MARGEDHHTNGSQFYITLCPLQWLDYQRVVFGRVIQGIDILLDLQNQSCPCERPNPDCIIKECSILSRMFFKIIKLAPGKHVV